jgi:hypothetical protein
VSRPEPLPDVQDLRNLPGRTADAQVVNDLMRALSQLGNLPNAPDPTSSNDLPRVAAIEPSESGAVAAPPAPRRLRFGGRIGALAIAYGAFVILIGGATYYLSASGLNQYRRAGIATVAASEASPKDAIAVRQPEVSQPVQPVAPTPVDLSQASTVPSPPPIQAAPAPPQDVEVNSTLLSEANSETNLPAIEEAATAPSETQLPAPLEALQPAPPAANQDAHEFREQGEALLASGDIVSARRFFEYAASRGDSAAARQAGQTYDAAFLHRAGTRGIPGDGDMATYWYRQAAADGDLQAAENLKRLLGERSP